MRALYDSACTSAGYRSPCASPPPPRVNKNRNESGGGGEGGKHLQAGQGRQLSQLLARESDSCSRCVFREAFHRLCADQGENIVSLGQQPRKAELRCGAALGARHG
jgi:hypothetical protein